MIERIIRYTFWATLTAPLVWIVASYRTGGLFYGEVIHVSGEWSARLLMLTMALTPLKLMFPGARWLHRLTPYRRYFGVAAFAYALVHTLVYVERKQSLSLILSEGAAFSMWTGWLALVIFLPLAVTSNDAAVRHLKRSWKRLHRWVYLAAGLTFAHWIFVAFDFVPGLVHCLVLLALEAYRVWKQRALQRPAA